MTAAKATILRDIGNGFDDIAPCWRGKHRDCE